MLLRQVINVKTNFVCSSC